MIRIRFDGLAFASQPGATGHPVEIVQITIPEATAAQERARYVAVLLSCQRPAILLD
jgi:hypothetical protein